jgi:superfamily II DNA helicase RecQ
MKTRESLQFLPAEAHACRFCDRRPSYLQLASLRTDFPGVPIAAVTVQGSLHVLFCPWVRSPAAAAAKQQHAAYSCTLHAHARAKTARCPCAQATATPRVKSSIIELLGLQSPVVIASSFNRPNIALTVRHKALLGAGTEDDLVEVGAGPRPTCLFCGA